MTTEAPPAAPDWFAVTILVPERAVRVDFDGGTYVRHLDQVEVLALIAELRRAIGLRPDERGDD